MLYFHPCYSLDELKNYNTKVDEVKQQNLIIRFVRRKVHCVDFVMLLRVAWAVASGAWRQGAGKDHPRSRYM